MKAPALNHLQKINSILDAMKKQSSNIMMSIIVNEPDEFSIRHDYTRHSIMNEYLSDCEISELATSMSQCGIEVSIHYGEREFIKNFINKEINNKNKIHIAFNTTGSGTGRAKTSLIPSFCSLCGVKICSADGYTSAILENKFHCFKLVSDFGFQTPRGWLYCNKQGWIHGAPPSGLKVIAKPNFECSSIGIDNNSVFFYDSHIDDLICKLSIEFRQEIFIQEFISGREVEVPVFPLPDPISPIAVGISIDDRKELGDEFLSYDIVGEGSYEFYNYEDYSGVIANYVKEQSASLYNKMGFSGFVRIDYRVSRDGRVCITDINTPPHLTKHSSYSYAMKCLGYNHSDLMLLLASIGINCKLSS